MFQLHKWYGNYSHFQQHRKQKPRIHPALTWRARRCAPSDLAISGQSSSPTDSHNGSLKHVFGSMMISPSVSHLHIRMKLKQATIIVTAIDILIRENKTLLGAAPTTDRTFPYFPVEKIQILSWWFEETWKAFGWLLVHLSKRNHCKMTEFLMRFEEIGCLLQAYFH